MNLHLDHLFRLERGNSCSFDDYYDVTDQSVETVAYISASTNKSGINGFVMPKHGDIIFPADIITVAVQGQGSVCFATVQPHSFIASKLVCALIPIEENFIKHSIPLDRLSLAVVCALIRKFKWRFSFGRAVDEERLGQLNISVDKIREVVSSLKVAERQVATGVL